MKLEFESWIENQDIDSEARSCFQESFTCFKAGAYKASLLFAYLGFAGVLRTRILAAVTPPTGFTAPHWQTIQAKLRSVETWDKTVFESIQQQNPGEIFVLTQDIRNQVGFWKDRRNDCAHSKQNKIVPAHVESFYAFIESNLSKFAVNGSRPAMLAAILRFFNPTITPPTQSIAPVIAEIPHAVPLAELPDFVNDVAAEFDRLRNPVAAAFNQENPNKLAFFFGCFRHGNDHLKNAVIAHLANHWDALVLYMRQNPSDVYVLGQRLPIIRRLWHESLFTDSYNDFPLLASLLRLRLIPAEQVQEALIHIAGRKIAHTPNVLDNAALREAGFYEALEGEITKAIPEGLGNFEWANGSRDLIIKFLTENPISRAVARSIDVAFSLAYHPWHLRDSLNSFFLANPQKVADYNAHLGGDPHVGHPTYIAALAPAPPAPPALPPLPPLPPPPPPPPPPAPVP